MSLAPWLHFKHKAKRIKTSSLPQRTVHGDEQILDENNPWWYCNVCHSYWLDTNCTDPQRVPMRNKWEGMFTRWVCDIGYVYLRPVLARLYPKLKTLPTEEQALEWHQKYNQYKQLLRAQGPEYNKAQQFEIQRLHDWIWNRQLQWCPPPHLSEWKTPVPLDFFRAAA